MSGAVRIHLKHEDFPDNVGPSTVEIVVDEPKALTADADELIEVVREAFVQARKSAAGAFLVDYESFGNDSAYLDRIDAVAGEMEVVEVSLVGDAKRYLVRGDYSTSDGGDWLEHVEAVTEAEARFQARWTMAENEAANVNPFGDFLDHMSEIEIVECDLEPVSKDEYRDALRAIVEEAVAAGHSGEALDKALEAMARDGYEPPAAGPRP